MILAGPLTVPSPVMIFGDHPIGCVKLSIEQAQGLLVAFAPCNNEPIVHRRHPGATRKRRARNPYSANVVMDSGPAPFGASRNDGRQNCGTAALSLPLAAHEIEVAAFVGLQDGLVEQMRIAAAG